MEEYITKHTAIMDNYDPENTIDLIAKYLNDVFGEQLLGSTYGQNNNEIVFTNNSLIKFCGKSIFKDKASKRCPTK